LGQGSVVRPCLLSAAITWLAPPAEMARNQAVPVSLAYKTSDSSRASEPLNKALDRFNMAERSESQISMNLAELFPPAHAAEVIEFDSIRIIQIQFTTLLRHESVPSYTDNVRPNALDTDESSRKGGHRCARQLRRRPQSTSCPSDPGRRSPIRSSDRTANSGWVTCVRNALDWSAPVLGLALRKK
jgi:hypothetical protein